MATPSPSPPTTDLPVSVPGRGLTPSLSVQPEASARELHGPADAKATPACELLELEDVTTTPAFFVCTSGELLWGQLHTVIEGSSGRGQSRVAARRGQWKVEAAYVDGEGGLPWHVGFVCHHVDADGAEVLRRAAEAGLGGGDGAEVVFVGRYDWSGCELGAEELGFQDEDYYQSLVRGRFMLVDPLGFPALMQALKNGARIEDRNYLMRTTTPSRDVFGTHLVVENSEYDMGWMVFRDGELVGFVYDGAYSALEGDNLRIGKNVDTVP